MNIIFTGGGREKGAYIVAMLEEAGHTVFSIGQGDRDFPANFAMLTPSVLDKAKGDMLRKFGKASENPLPDAIIHNARTTSGNINHAFFCNINARMTLDNWALGMLESKPNHFRSIHLMGWSAKWAQPSYPALVCEGAQLAMPLAFVSQLPIFAEKAREAEVLRDQAKRLFDSNEDKREKAWVANERETVAAHKKLKKEYTMRKFPRKTFPEPAPIWVPNISAIAIVAGKEEAKNNAISKETMAKVVLHALDWECTDEQRYEIMSVTSAT